ncbi:MAG: hypothetical protein ACFB0E_04380 [Leptolyngbyaceae cyanobacterium]
MQKTPDCKHIFFSRLQRQWLVAILLISLVLPVVLAALLVVTGKATGCQMAGSAAQPCLIWGVNIGHLIRALIDWAWYMPVRSVFEVPFLSATLLIGTLALIYKSFPGWSRALIGFFSVWYICFTPAIAATVLVVFLAKQADCALNEGGVGSCHLFGSDMSSTFHTAASMPWLLIIAFPLCVLLSFIYLFTALMRQGRDW